MATKKTDVPESASAQDGLGLTDAELAAARKEGAKEDAKEAAKDTHRFLTDGQNLGDNQPDRWLGSDEVMQYAPTLDLSVEDFEKRINGKDDVDLPEEKIYGLLKLERSGQNRTPYVKAMMKRLGLKKEDLPAGGPSYTNDLTSVSDL